MFSFISFSQAYPIAHAHEEFRSSIIQRLKNGENLSASDINILRQQYNQKQLIPLNPVQNVMPETNKDDLIQIDAKIAKLEKELQQSKEAQAIAIAKVL